MLKDYRNEPITWENLLNILGEYLSGQRELSYSELEEVCLYRKNDGAMCIVGSFIEDSAYSLSIEHHAVFSPLVFAMIEHKLSEGIDISILSAFQRVHDYLAERIPYNINNAFETIDASVPDHLKEKWENLKLIIAGKQNND